MEQTVPIEEIARQRLEAMVYAYTLLIHHLREEGVDVAKVQRASDKTWAVLGGRTAERLRGLFPQPAGIESLWEVAAMTEAVHDIEARHEVSAAGIYSEYVACPWQKAFEAIGLTGQWRLCESGHQAFGRAMFQGLNPKARFDLSGDMPAGAALCKSNTTV